MGAEPKPKSQTKKNKTRPALNLRRAYVSSSFLQGFGALVLEKGGDAKSLLAQVELSPEIVSSQSRLISFESFIALLELASDQLDMPDFAFLLLQRQSVEILGPLSRLLSDAKSVREVFHRIAQHLSLVVSGIELEVTETHNCVELYYQTKLPLIENKPAFQFYLLGATFLVLSATLPIDRRIRSVHFKTEIADEAVAKSILRFFQCPVKFESQGLKLSFSEDIFSSTVSSRLGIFPGIWSDNEPISVYVEKLIGLLLPSKNATFENVAHMLGVSQSTLYRHLAREKTTFKKLIMSVRLSLADDYLKNTPYSLQEISLLLGYANQSAFSRSYLGSTGCLPSVARLRFLDE